MFSKKYILEFCNVQMIHHRDKWEVDGVMNLAGLASQYIYDHALETDSPTKNAELAANVLEAVATWWKESKFNTGYTPLKY